MVELPSWVGALAGAVAAGLVMWGAFRETLRRHTEDISALRADATAQRTRLDTANERIARLEGRAEQETP